MTDSTKKTYEPTTALDWLEQAEQHEDNDETEAALEAVEKAIEIDSRLGRAWCLKASLLQDLDRPSEAFRTLNDACQRLPHDADCWFETGAFLMAHNSAAQAAECFSRALERDADYPRIHANFGIALAGCGHYAEAVEHLSKALDEAVNDNDKAHLLNRLGEASIGAGDLDKAAEYLNQSVELNENDFTAIGNYAMVRIRKNEPAEALECLKPALNIAPKEAKLHLIRGIALGQLGKTEEAGAEFDKAAELSPKDPEVWFHKAQHQVSLNHPDEALACYDKGIAINSLVPDLWFGKSQLLHALKREPEAVECHRHALTLTGRLVVWGIFLVDADEKPVEGSKVAVETDRSIPPERIVQEYINNLVTSKKHTVDDKGMVDGKYRVGLMQLPPDVVNHGNEAPATEATTTEDAAPETAK